MYPKEMRKKIKVIYRKLGRERSWGWAHCADFLVEVDERLKGKKKMEILHHECLHVLFPEASEEEIEAKAVMLTNTIWHEGARFVDNENKTPLQDGSL